MLLSLKNVSKLYRVGEVEIRALADISFTVERGEFVAVMGPSGSGKSTFLQIASMLNDASSGEIILNGTRVEHYNEVEQARLRNQEIGFIFQQFNLLPRTTAIDNVALPLLYTATKPAERRARAIALLEKVGLGDRLMNTSSQLSGGQQQRVAIARALINNPSIIFADEPTGNLDSKSGEEIKGILRQLHAEGKTIIMVTHEEDVAAIAKRLIFFQDGEIVYDEKIGWNSRLKTPHTEKQIAELRAKLRTMKRERTA